MNRGDLDGLARASRLAELGVEVRSGELLALAKQIEDWSTSGGNRAMRRAARRSLRRRGRC